MASSEKAQSDSGNDFHSPIHDPASEDQRLPEAAEDSPATDRTPRATVDGEAAAAQEVPQAVSQDESSDILFDADFFTNTDIKQMADAIDSLRTIGLGSDVALPQIVVIGDQSSGKSSLLESLTKLPFPVGFGTCTRFGVEVNLRRDPEQTVHVSAMDSKSNPNPRLAGFARSYDGTFAAAEFLERLDDFSARLDLPLPGNPGSRTTTTTEGPGIANVMMRLEAKGPKHTMLSFVDTPGLFVTGSKDAHEKDAPRVKRLVQGLIAPDRTIIIAVMDARRQVESEQALSMAAEVDPDGRRTIGVLTKCDAVQAGDEHESALRIARNITRTLNNGWFVVRNRTGSERHATEEGPSVSVAEAHERENELFATAQWSTVPSNKRGSRMLQEYVTELYAGHVRQQFPRVRDEILMKMARAKADLADLGLPRTTASQQRRYLVEMQERHKARVEALMSQHMPFVRQDTKDPSGSPWQRKALLTSSFLDKMDLDGCQFAFLHQDDGNELRYENDAARSIDELRRIKKQRPVEDHNIYQWINRRYHEAYAPSLCGLVSEELILALFREQTTPWLGIAKEFLESVGSTLMHVFDLAMKEACQDEHIRQAIQGPCESAQLALATTAERDLRRLISREQKGLCTSSPQFNADVFVARSRRLETALRKLVPAGEPTNGLASEGRISQSLLANPTALQGVLQYPRDAVYEVHDLLALYYGYAKQRFQDNVIQLCNEMMLADDGIPLVFTNVWVNGLNEQELSDLCRENARTSARRSDLSEQLRRFEASIEQIGEIIPSLKGTALGRSSASDVSLGQRAYIEYNNGANYGPGSKSMVPRIAPHDEQRMIFNSPLRSSNNGSARTPQAESFNFVPSINGPVGSRYDAAPTMGMVQKPGQRDQRPDPNLTSTYEADSAQRIRNQKTNNQVMATASTTQTAQPHGKNPIAPSIAGNPPFAASAPQNATARPSSSLIQPTTEAAQYLRPNPFEAVTTSSTHFRRASSPRGSRPASSGGRNAATRPSVFAASSPGPSLFEDP